MPTQHAIISPDTILAGENWYDAIITVVNDVISIQPVGAPPPYSDLSILFDADDRIAINDLLQASGQSNPPDLSTPDLTQRLVALEDKVARHAENTRVRTAHLHQRIIDIDKAAGNLNLSIAHLQNMVEADQRLHDEQSTTTRRRLNEHAEFAGHLKQRIVSIEQTLRILDDSTAAQIARLIHRLDTLEAPHATTPNP